MPARDSLLEVNKTLKKSKHCCAFNTGKCEKILYAAVYINYEELILLAHCFIQVSNLYGENDMKQHPTAIVDPAARIDEDVKVGPYVVIEGPVRIASGTVIMAHAYICGNTEIGHDNQIHIGAVIGHVPQHQGYKPCVSYTRIGDRNVIREYVTIHRSWQEGESTIIGDDNFLMAHDCKIGNRVVIANGALLGGHVQVEDKAFLSGNTVFHQYVRIGRLAMISGLTGIGKDVPPYCIAVGRSEICGVNVVGLRRAGIPPEHRSQIQKAYKILYRSGLNTKNALKEIEAMNPCEEVGWFVEFIRNSKRGICRAANWDSEQ